MAKNLPDPLDAYRIEMKVPGEIYIVPPGTPQPPGTEPRPEINGFAVFVRIRLDWRSDGPTSTTTHGNNGTH